MVWLIALVIGLIAFDLLALRFGAESWRERGTRPNW